MADGCSWLFFHRIWLTALVSLAVLGWWTLFLIVVPSMVEDT